MSMLGKLTCHHVNADIDKGGGGEFVRKKCIFNGFANNICPGLSEITKKIFQAAVKFVNIWIFLLYNL